MKILLALILILWISSGIHASNAHPAQKNTATVSIPDKEAIPGTVVEVPVTATGFQNLHAIELRFRFNQHVLNASHEYGSYITNLHPSLAAGQFNLANDSTIIFSWYSIMPVSLADGDKLFDLKFFYCESEVSCALNNYTSPISFIEDRTFIRGKDLVLLPLNMNNGSVYSGSSERVLIIDISGNGQVRVDGSPYSEPIFAEQNAQVLLEALPATGWEFEGWSGDLSGTENPTQLLMDASKEVTASFSKIPEPYEFSIQISGQGTVTVDGQPYTSSMSVDEGSILVLAAIPEEGHELLNWTDADGQPISQEAGFSFTMPSEDTSLTANFQEIPVEPDTYTLTLTADPPGGGSVQGGGEYEAGDDVSIAATPATGYHFVNWTGEDDTQVSANPQYSFSMPAQDLSLTAHFALNTYSVAASPNNPDFGSVSGAGTYEHGAQVNLLATPAEGYRFVNWTENGTEVSASANYVFTATADRSLTATFEEITAEPQKYTLSLRVEPSGTGTATGEGEYEAGDEVTVTATPAQNYEFVSWTHDGTVVSTETPYSFAMPAGNLELTARFSIKTYTIELDVNDNTMGQASGGGAYAHGNFVEVLATPAEGFRFVNWTENGIEVSTSSSYSFTATTNRILVAHFAPASYTLELYAVPVEGGSTAGGGSYAMGDEVTIEANANEGYSFVEWTAEDNQVFSTLNPHTFSMSAANLALTANFRIHTYEISASPNNPDFGSVSGSGTYEHGAQVVLTATPATGYHFVNWTENGSEVSAEAVYAFEALSGRELVANFRINTYTITASPIPAEGGTINGMSQYTATYQHGDEVTLTAEANPDFEFICWVEGDQLIECAESVYVFTATSDRDLLVNFDAGSVVITARVQPEGAGKVSGGGIVQIGEQVSLTAGPSDGYEFVHWTEYEEVVSTEPLYGFMAETNRTLTAHFSPIDYSLQLNVHPEGAGSVAGAGTYQVNDEVVVLATASEGYHFVSWTGEEGEVLSTQTEFAFTMPASDIVLTAHFEKTAYTVSVSIHPEEGGVVTGSGPYTMGETVTLEAEAAEGYAFLHWTDAGNEVVSAEPVYAFSMPAADVNLIALFEPLDYTVMVSVYPDGAGTVTGAGSYRAGEDVALEATATEGYVFAGWMDDSGNPVSGDNPYTFVMPAANVSLWANFEPVSVEIGVDIRPAGSGSVSGDGTYDYGQQVVLEATPASGYRFESWSENNAAIGTEPELSFIAQTDRDIEANFRLISHTITATAGQGGSISPSGAVGVTHGGDQAFAIEADQGYEIADVLIDGESQGPLTQYIFEEVSRDHSIHAEFAPITFTVRFNVNMTYASPVYAGTGFDPESDAVYLAGNFFGDWSSPGSDPENQKLTPSSDPMIYTITLQLEAGTYYYKYFVNEGWDGGEWDGDPNREVVVTENTEVHDWFGSMNDPTDAPHPGQQVSVRAYPVPADGRLNIESSAPIAAIRVFDAMGNTLMSLSAGDVRHGLDVSQLANGTYFLYVITTEGQQTLPIQIFR